MTDATPDRAAPPGKPAPQDGRGRHCRVFEESARLGGRFTLRDTGITVAELLEQMDSDGVDAVLARHKGVITRRDLDICRTIAAHYMPEREEYRRNGGDTTVKILLDENMPHVVIPRALNDDSRLVHISFRRLTTMSDAIIWRFAKQNGFEAILTSDDDFIKMVEMETLGRLQTHGNFAAADVADLPFVVYMTSRARQTHLMDEEKLKANIRTIVDQATGAGRRLAYAVIDQDGLRPGLTVEGIYAKYMRASIAGTAVDRPVFDRAIMDYNAINTLRQKCGMKLLQFTADAEWKEFYDRAYAKITATRQSGPSARPS